MYLCRLKRKRYSKSDLTVSGMTIKTELFHMTSVIHPLLSIVAGVIILVWPTILNYVIALWLILTGVLSYFSV